jgi:hypothetical protein
LKHVLTNTLTLFFAGLLLFNTGSSLVFLLLKEHAIEEDFERALKNGQVNSSLIVEFSADDVAGAHWEHSREIELNGHYYDLVSTYKKNGQTVYRFIADEDETKLFTAYKQQHSQQGKQKGKNTTAHSNNWYLPAAFTIPIHNYIHTASINSTTLLRISQTWLTLNVPPPKG